MEKNKLVLSVVGIAILLLSLVAVTYAYFTVGGTSNSSEVRIVSGSTTLVLDDVDPITVEDKVGPNNTDIIRYLSIKNEGTVDAYAKLLFKDLLNTFVTNDLTYTLEEVSSNKTSINIIINSEVVPKNNSVNNTELANGLLIPSNTTKYYKITINYNYRSDVNQDADLNKVLTSGFTIEEGNKVEIKQVYCIDDNGDEITCPSVLSVGQRVAIGRDANRQTFRYIRTTDTNSMLNECGGDTGEYTPCHDTTDGKARLLSEKSLKVGINTVSPRDLSASNVVNEITSEDKYYGMQDLEEEDIKEDDNGMKNFYNVVSFSTDTKKGTYYSSYNGSLIETYVTNYMTNLNNKYFNGSNIVNATLITAEEIDTLGCSIEHGTISGGYCSDAPDWIKNKVFWTISPSTQETNYIVLTEMYGPALSTGAYYASAKPIIEIDETMLH